MLKELQRLLEQRRQLDRQISGLRVAVNGLNATIKTQRNKYELRSKYEFDPTPLDPEYEGIREMGLTDAVRRVLEHAIEGMTPKDVRAKLHDLDYKKLPASNALAALHGIFTRLEKAGEIAPTQPGDKTFRWIPPIERIAGSTPLDAVEFFNPGVRLTERFRSRHNIKTRRPRLKG